MPHLLFSPIGGMRMSPAATAGEGPKERNEGAEMIGLMAIATVNWTAIRVARNARPALTPDEELSLDCCCDDSVEGYGVHVFASSVLRWGWLDSTSLEWIDARHDKMDVARTWLRRTRDESGNSDLATFSEGVKMYVASTRSFQTRDPLPESEIVEDWIDMNVLDAGLDVGKAGDLMGGR